MDRLAQQYLDNCILVAAIVGLFFIPLNVIGFYATLWSGEDMGRHELGYFGHSCFAFLYCWAVVREGLGSKES
jgi:hypothetical protein